MYCMEVWVRRGVLDLPGFLQITPNPWMVWPGCSAFWPGASKAGWFHQVSTVSWTHHHWPLHNAVPFPKPSLLQSTAALNLSSCPLRTYMASLSRVCHDESIGSPKGDFNISYYPTSATSIPLLPHYTGRGSEIKTYFPQSTENAKI